MSVVHIGYHDYLMPAAVGMKVVQLLAQAINCESRYDGDCGMKYELGDPVDVSYRSVRNNQLIMPSDRAPLDPRLTRQPRLLGRD